MQGGVFMFWRKQDDRNFVEKNNDAILFWEYIGTPVIVIVGTIVIITLIIGGFKLKHSIAHKKTLSEEQTIYEVRVDILNTYIEKNKEAFGDIEKQWNEDNIFYIKNNKGTFSVRFVGNEIFEVVYTLDSGPSKTLYQR